MAPTFGERRLQDCAKKRRLDPGQIEVLDPLVAAVLREKSPAERVAMIFACNRTMRLRLYGQLHSRHPDWDDAQIQNEIARRMLGGAT